MNNGRNGGLAQNSHERVPLKIPEWLPSTSQATRLQVACRALWPRKSKDSGDCGISGERGSEKTAGSRQNEEISGKRAEVSQTSRERGCSKYVAGAGQGGWPAMHSLGLVCQTSRSWLAWRNSMGPTGG